MNTIELDTKRTRVYALQKKSTPFAERKKMMDDFWSFIDNIRRPTTNYKFNREECYE